MHRSSLCFALVLAFTVTGCGAESDDQDAGSTGSDPTPRTIGGVVNDLVGSRLVLQNRGADDLAIAKNGAFTFSTPVADGASYDVTVSAQPTDPAQTCTVAGGSGTVAGANVSDIVVDCASSESYAIGGTVVGLTQPGLVLENNGGDDLEIDADGAFTFATPVVDGGGYEVTVLTAPQSCTVENAAGMVAGADVTDVMVSCSDVPVAIDELSASAPTVAAGDLVTLTWVTRGAGSCTLDPGAIAATPAPFGTADVAVPAATTFTLTCQGLGGPVSRSVDVNVTDADWLEVSAGNAHTCAVKTDGRLFCWGDIVPSLVPVQESTMATDWVHVASGGAHACAIKSDGRLFCWGWGSSGQLGTGGFPSQLATPTQENSMASDWAQVAAGYTHTCAVKTDGRLFCWGEGGNGRLGRGSTSDSAVPVQEDSMATDWELVSAGWDHTCALTSDGRMFCWGSGAYGALGSAGSSLVPVQEASLASDWQGVAVGTNHTCAVKSDGRLFCVGQATYGQLGNPGAAGGSTWVQETTMASDWDGVTAGNFHSCAHKTDGRVFCWGESEFGELGDDSLGVNATPVQEQTLATDWESVAASYDHTCALKAGGEIFCWGSRRYGQLGNDREDFSSPEEVRSPVPWAQASAGSAHGCGVTSNGRLYCWGLGEDGLLGNNSDASSLAPVQEYTLATDWAQVAAGDFHTCGLKTDGRIFCWGANYFGALGNNSNQPSQTLVQEYSMATDWVEVTAGLYHTCARKSDGRVFCWGDNLGGQLGHPGGDTSDVPVQEETLATDWVGVEAGLVRTCALKSDQRLFCWGGTPAQESSMASDWMQFGAGVAHVCGVKSSGQLFCWGSGGSGQLGNNSDMDSPDPVQEFTMAANWAEVSPGNLHTCATKTTGELFCWGYNVQGQLGIGNTGDSWVPVQETSGDTSWRGVNAGDTHSCGMKEGGRLFCWGDNDNGQLGLGARLWAVSPTP